MVYALTPTLNEDDIFLHNTGETEVVWFVDYGDETFRRVRDVFRRSLDRIDTLNLKTAIRFNVNENAGASSLNAAKAAIAAHRQGRFEDMHQALFTLDHTAYSTANVRGLAKTIGLDLDQFDADFAADTTKQKITTDRASAMDSFPVPHAPMMFINGIFYEGVWDDSAVAEALEQPLGIRINMASTAFFRWAASAGLILILATLAALLFVNLGGAETYHHWQTMIGGIRLGEFSLELPLEIWINDGLMAIFFLIVGIEIKRELVVGELSTPERAALPLIGAIGGMTVPALIYAAVNWGTPTAHGWGVPMATDIAFTLGILALLGSRIPTSLKVFVSALAIADDLGAIIVIALFYGHGFHFDALMVAGIVLAIMFGLNIGKVYHRTPYLILGVILWYFVHESGLHATLAGVLTAAAIPSRRSGSVEAAALQAQKVFEYELQTPESPAGHASISVLENIVERLRDPGFHLQHALERWSNYLILPLFAFFNTGVLLFGTGFTLTAPEVSGTMLGLIVGKTVGIFGFVYIAVKLGFAKLSSEISWTQLLGAASLCGIGFTMSIFIASAAFEGDQLQAVKLSILLASVIAGVIGTMILATAKSTNKTQ